jgi:hypothetical protein
MAQNHQNHQKSPKSPKMTKITQNDPKSLKITKIIRNQQKLPKITKMTKNQQNHQKWPKIHQNHPKSTKSPSLFNVPLNEGPVFSVTFTADVIVTENTGPSFSGTLNNEGDFVDFGYVLEEVDWDYISNMQISHFDVVVDWSSSGGAGGGRQVTLDVSSQNNTAGESQNDGGNGGTITIIWPVNQLPPSFWLSPAVLFCEDTSRVT